MADSRLVCDTLLEQQTRLTHEALPKVVRAVPDKVWRWHGRTSAELLAKDVQALQLVEERDGVCLGFVVFGARVDEVTSRWQHCFELLYPLIRPQLEVLCFPREQRDRTSSLDIGVKR